ncbi:MAG: hypothetical protein K2N34_02295, partial [Lachnospiraceae bacterium]|nr:hypothetical protein [Lachnospiraceae bacterium]
DEYLVYDSDSALYYASESRKLAENAFPDDYNLITNWKLNQAFIFTVQGLYDKTMALVENIETEKLDNETKGAYFGTLAYLYSMRSIYLNKNQKLWEEEIKKANQYRDSIQSLHPELSEDWLWIPVATALDRTDKDISGIDITPLRNLVDRSTTPSRQNAINAYWLSRFYEEKKDETMAVKYKTMAAIYDALIVNREIAALQELATYLFDHDELNRAYIYLLYAVNQANLYHNRYRMVSLSDVLPTVRDKYRDELEKRDKRLSVMVWLLTILALILLGCVVFIVMELNKLKKMKNLLKEANTDLNLSVKDRDNAIKKLENTNAELHNVNKRLNEANSQKIGLLAYAFKLTTQCINELEDYRKKLLKKYKAKRYDDMGVLINDPELIKEHYQGFYESFDKMVFSLFPDFIEEYNSSASPENRVDPEQFIKNKTLNTRLRIYALRRLGVSKSSDIASMLNVSIRTVYNNKNNGGTAATD